MQAGLSLLSLYNDKFMREGEPSFESKESQSKVNFRILYSAHESHGSEGDFWTPEQLENELQDIDIWFLENAGWTEETEAVFKAFATGKHEVPKNTDPVLKNRLTALSNLGKAGKKIEVGFVDFPEDHPLLKYIDLDPTQAVVKFLDGKLESAIIEIKSIARKYASVQKVREEYMQKRAEVAIEHMAQTDPYLQEKINKGEKLNVLMTLGTFHTGVSHNLKKEGHVVETQFNHELPFTFSPLHELMRRYRFNKDVDDQLAAQAVCYAALLSELTFLDGEKAGYVAGKIVRTLKLADIRLISVELKSKRGIRDVAEQFGFTIPRSKTEAEELFFSKKV